MIMKTLTESKRRFGSLALLLTVLAAAVQPAAAQAPAGSDNRGPTLGRIASDGAIYIAHRESAIPFSYVSSGEQDATVHGFSWELCGHVTAAIQQRLGRDVKVVPVAVSANSRIMMVKVGMAEMECGATTNNVARQKQVAFSNTIYVANVRALVRKDSGVRRIADLADKRVVTTLGTTADRLVKQAALANNITMQYLVARSHNEAIDMMRRGEADAYVGDDAIIAGERAKAGMNDRLVFLDDILATEPYGIMLPKDDTQFKKLVDGVIVGLMQSGEFARIYDKWFMSPIPPTGITLQMPMSEQLKAAIANPNDRPSN